MGDCVKFKERQKNDKIKPFLLGDIFVYLTVALLVLALFTSFFFLSKDRESKGFIVSLSGKTVFTYDLDNDKFKVENEFSKNLSIEQSKGGYIVTVLINEEDYNKIFIDKEHSEISVVESTCKKEYCVHSPAIGKKGAIYCDPHGLKIMPIGADGFSDSIIVG